MNPNQEPIASRPYMPGYGVQPASEGSGLLPWSWAVQRLTDSHEYWVAAVGAEGAPHLMPVWAVWFDDALWFSSSPTSRRARSLTAHRRCAVATDDPHEPVVIEGEAEQVNDGAQVEVFADRSNAKYGTNYGADFYLDNATFRVRPLRVLALDDTDFTGSPTRWVFDGGSIDA